MANLFKEIWKANNGEDMKALTKSELIQVQGIIFNLQKKGYPSSKIITALQKTNQKLNEKWRAERAYWTTVKQDDTKAIADLGDDLGFTKYKVILSPNACPLCIQKTNNGRKVFDQREISKSGYGQFVPWHPNCYCIVVPEG